MAKRPPGNQTNPRRTVFDAKPITHQNLSEWRLGGYKEWLQHQQRMEWYDNLYEHDAEINDRDCCLDYFEAFGRLMLAELGQSFAGLQDIRNPDLRFDRLRHISQQFTRLQNSFNKSRKVLLGWRKFNIDPKKPILTRAPENPKPEIHPAANAETKSAPTPPPQTPNAGSAGVPPARPPQTVPISEPRQPEKPATRNPEPETQNSVPTPFQPIPTESRKINPPITPPHPPQTQPITNNYPYIPRAANHRRYSFGLPG